MIEQLLRRLTPRRSGRITPQPVEQVVGLAFLLDALGGGQAVAANPLMEILSVAARLDRGHQDIFGRHERQLRREIGGDDSRIDNQPGSDVLQQQQHRVGSQKCLRDYQPAVGTVVERPLHPLHGRRGGSAGLQADDEPR